MPLGFLGVEPAVDDHPAVALLEEPEVDVVEREGERHAQPVDAGRHGGGDAQCRRRRMGKTQRGVGAVMRTHGMLDWLPVQTRSRIAAMPWPTPMHMETSA